MISSAENIFVNKIAVMLNEILLKKGVPPDLLEQARAYEALQQLTENLLAIREFTHVLSTGDLSQSLELKGYWAGAIKALQSNLRHLTWQTSMVAKGDLSQRVDFMGEFSEAFNTMTHRLKVAEENEKRYTAELEKREAELRIQKSCLQQLFEKSPDAMAMLDKEYLVLNVNPSFEKIFGITSQEAKGKPVDQLISCRDMGEETQAIRDTIAAGKTVTIDTLRYHANGSAVYVSLSVFPFITETGHVGIYTIYRDISERVKAEKMLRESERKYRLIAENTDDVIWLVDKKMNINYISPSVEKLLGYTPEEYALQPVADRILPPLETAIQELAGQEQGEKDTYPAVLTEFEQERKNGDRIWTESLVCAAKNDAGDFIGFLGVTRDINKRRQAENLLHRSYDRRRRNDFFNGLINNGIPNEAEVYTQAWRLGIQLAKRFALYLLQADPAKDIRDDMDDLRRKQSMADTIVDHLNNMQDGVIAWETAEGIVILRLLSDGSDRKGEEQESAHACLCLISRLFADTPFYIGIADYYNGLEHFAIRIKNAQAAITVGSQVSPRGKIYHFEDLGVYQILAQFADTSEAEAYIARTIGRLIDYDQKNGTELVETLENILSTSSLKEVAEQMFFHYKTIQSRKQRIEKILDLSLDSFEVRLMLGMAIRMLKISQRHAPATTQ